MAIKAQEAASREVVQFDRVQNGGDVFVRNNSKRYLIQRGKGVEVPANVAHTIARARIARENTFESIEGVHASQPSYDSF